MHPPSAIVQLLHRTGGEARGGRASANMHPEVQAGRRRMPSLLICGTSPALPKHHDPIGSQHHMASQTLEDWGGPEVPQPTWLKMMH